MKKNEDLTRDQLAKKLKKITEKIIRNADLLSKPLNPILTKQQKVFKGVKVKIISPPSNKTLKGIERNTGVKSFDGIAFPKNYNHMMTVKIPKWEIWAVKHCPDLMKTRLKLQNTIHEIENEVRIAFDLHQQCEVKSD